MDIYICSFRPLEIQIIISLTSNLNLLMNLVEIINPSQYSSPPSFFRKFIHIPLEMDGSYFLGKRTILFTAGLYLYYISIYKCKRGFNYLEALFPFLNFQFYPCNILFQKKCQQPDFKLLLLRRLESCLTLGYLMFFNLFFFLFYTSYTSKHWTPKGGVPILPSYYLIRNKTSTSPCNYFAPYYISIN